uniref:Ubiquitin-like protease family profile domain-containing protein n=1 Tax=viral metagenome TaxID=1070528 RepID=A0A6C0IJ83_9ZZZZ
MKKGRKTKKISKFKKNTKKYKQRGGNKDYLHKTPGPQQCHPRVGENRSSEGCIPIDILKKVADKLKIDSNSQDLRKQIEEKLNVKPIHEYSFVKALPLDEKEKQSLIKQYLRPKMPESWKSDPDKWLNSNDITYVMEQYEEAFPAFEFMGPHPIDFAAPDPYTKDGKCLINEMCEIRVTNALKEGTESIGVIYNLDPHFKGGSHWVAVYIDLKHHKTYYFDSYAIEPPKQIATFMKWLTTQDSEMKLFYNGNRFQKGGSECGMYSMYFIIRMLEGDDFQAFSRTKPPDSFMLDLRDWMFST